MKIYLHHFCFRFFIPTHPESLPIRYKAGEQGGTLSSFLAAGAFFRRREGARGWVNIKTINKQIIGGSPNKNHD
jgi:hypothetical protein